VVEIETGSRIPISRTFVFQNGIVRPISQLSIEVCRRNLVC